MGSSNRALHIAKLNYKQPKVMPDNKYAYFAGGFGAGKTSAMLTKAREAMQERNDASDALEYTIQSLYNEGTMSSTTTSLSTEGTLRTLGSWSSTEHAVRPPTGTTSPYVDTAEDLYKQRLLDRQPQDLMRCIYMLSHVFQRLTERRIELDSSDLRTLEPFEYRIRMNHLDELFMFVTHLMDNMTVETRPEGLRETLVERGLV